MRAHGRVEVVYDRPRFVQNGLDGSMIIDKHERVSLEGTLNWCRFKVRLTGNAKEKPSLSAGDSPTSTVALRFVGKAGRPLSVLGSLGAPSPGRPRPREPSPGPPVRACRTGASSWFRQWGRSPG